MPRALPRLESAVSPTRGPASRGRGVLEWQGQLLLKGKDDAAPVKLVAGKEAAAAQEEAKEVELS